MTSQAVAISTTGHEHRLGFLETSVRQWGEALGHGDRLFVTVDGSEQDAANVAEVMRGYTSSVYRVGQSAGPMARTVVSPKNGRWGVAANKNTGLELMMDHTRADHLFLSDDDCGPRSNLSLRKHTDLDIPHSMVCWGAHRLDTGRRFPHTHAEWTWPRGVMLYTHRTVVDKVGGMVEAFGAGGHEHAEWSRRIHQHGFTPAPYCSPLVYAMYSIAGQANRADRFWDAQDMRKIGETSVNLGHRRAAISTLSKVMRDYAKANEIMMRMDGSTDYVPFRSHENGRASATLCSTSTGLGAGGDL